MEFILNYSNLLLLTVKQRQKKLNGHLKSTWIGQPVQIFFGISVVLESICYRTIAKRLINERNATGWLEKFGREGIVWMGILLPAGVFVAL